MCGDYVARKIDSQIKVREESAEMGIFGALYGNMEEGAINLAWSWGLKKLQEKKLY